MTFLTFLKGMFKCFPLQLLGFEPITAVWKASVLSTRPSGLCKLTLLCLGCINVNVNHKNLWNTLVSCDCFDYLTVKFLIFGEIERNFFTPRHSGIWDILERHIEI